MLLMRVRGSHLVLLAPANPCLIDVSLTGLTNVGNPILPVGGTPLDVELKRVPLLRDVDWRRGEMKPISTVMARRAAIVQQAGMVAPVGKVCGYCSRGLGPFASCVVLVFEGTPHFKGSCANCNFNAGGKGCSHRMPSFLHDLFYLLTIGRR